MATMKEVANRAGVSVATVSRVINQSGYVRAVLQTRVHEAMRELRYHPSALARSLRRQETLTVGLLLPQLDQPFFSRVAQIIMQALFKQNYRTLVCSSEEDSQQEAAYIDMLIRQRVDGIIVAPISLRTIHTLSEQDMPVVIFDRDVSMPKAGKVFSSHRHGGYQAISHLIDFGHRKIAIIGKEDAAVSVSARIEGAQQAMREADLAPAAVYLEHWHSDIDVYASGYDMAKHVLSLAPEERPTAIFALTDVTAVGVIRAISDAGMRVPDDISVIGFDDIPLARLCIPSLTTILQPADDMGLHAAEMLLKALATHEPVAGEVVLETRLVVRESTRRISG